MKVGINGYEAVIPRFGYDENGLPRRVGSSEYCYELLVNLNRIDKENEYFIYLPVKPTEDLPLESEKWHYRIVKKRTLWTFFDLSREFVLKREKLNVFFSPTHYLPIFSPFPSAMSIMDLSFIHFPGLFKKKDLYQLKFWTKLSVKKAKKIFTISQVSKDDIIRIYKVPESRVVVTYPGIKSEIRNPKFETNSKFKMQNSKLFQEKYGIQGDYLLFVGTLQPRKNIKRLIEAFSKLGKNDIDLIIVGKKGWMFEEIINAPKKFGVEEKVRFLDFVTDEELSILYKNALCFVLPSLYEGFGLPVLEAMQNGCPVITSNISSLPEAGGDAALYVNPDDIDDITEKIQKVISDKKLRNDMIEKGYKQVKRFNWKETAKQTLESLEKIANK